MRKAIIISLILIMSISIFYVPQNNVTENGKSDKSVIFDYDAFSISSVSQKGDTRNSTMYMNQVLTDKQISILNTYRQSDIHTSELSLAEFLIPDWTLYKVEMEIDNITAAEEREVLGVNADYHDFQTEEYMGSYYDQLSQEFYNQPHNGSLVNFSIYYRTGSSYSPASTNYAFLVVRSNKSSPSANITTPEQIESQTIVFEWLTVTETANLTQDTYYYTLIDGKILLDLGTYPIIEWSTDQTDPDPILTERHYTFSDEWNLESSREALLNYTYIPWNQTSNSALVFTSPEQISLEGNSSALTSHHWEWTKDNENITSLSFSSNQSIRINYNLTLWYEQDTTTTTGWEITNPQEIVEWNSTTTV
ncbi:MAG: hypothetical protein GF411_15465, partial [Candidatus Lokiarchaeota archaeon]|nr:hypothetical protein [Candidatus Lokiarchaeota archaeon]